MIATARRRRGVPIAQGRPRRLRTIGFAVKESSGFDDPHDDSVAEAFVSAMLVWGRNRSSARGAFPRT
jgi:hypothetical protein